MVNLERLKTVNLYEKKDPVRDLWRNVLIVGIEDLIKKRNFNINGIEKHIV